MFRRYYGLLLYAKSSNKTQPWQRVPSCPSKSETEPRLPKLPMLAAGVALVALVFGPVVLDTYVYEGTLLRKSGLTKKS